MFFIQNQVSKNLVHGYDIHEVLYQNGEIHVPWVSGRVLGLGRFGHIVKMYMIFKKITCSTRI